MQLWKKTTFSPQSSLINIPIIMNRQFIVKKQMLQQIRKDFFFPLKKIVLHKFQTEEEKSSSKK